MFSLGIVVSEANYKSILYLGALIAQATHLKVYLVIFDFLWDRVENWIFIVVWVATKNNNIFVIYRSSWNESPAAETLTLNVHFLPRSTR